MTQYAVVDPRTGRNVVTAAAASDDDIQNAIAAAHRVSARWANETPLAERTRLLLEVGALHRRRRAELAETIELEMGKPREDALAEVDFSAAIYTYYAEHAAEFLADEVIQLADGPGTAVVQRRPLGVLLGIMPWNYPSYQVARFAAPNLAAGNTVLLKHAPQCPLSSAMIEEIFRDAGLPAGTYTNLYASNEQVETIIADPRVQGVSLTGSERAGAAVAATAGRHLKKVVLELGGSDPLIVLDSADLDDAVEGALAARLENAGQCCNGAKRLIVVHELYDEFVDRFTRRFLDTPPVLLSSQAAAERLEEQVERAVAQGAERTSRAGRGGAFYPPTVLTAVTAENDVYREELFGPVAMLFRVADEAEAVAVANDTPYGLGSYLYTEDAAQAQRVADQLQVGMVYINGVDAEGAEIPFGGVKRSGFGRELGRDGIEEFVNKKLVRRVR